MKNVLFIFLLLPSFMLGQIEEVECWKTLNYFLGAWEGIGEGKWGNSTVEREYQLVLGSSYIIGKNKSVYEPQDKNPNGEIHQNWDIFSYDISREKIVLRQFHDEKFVNQYVAESISTDGKYIEFITENIENFSKGWRAKETYKIIDENEFIEKFYLSAPDKEFKLFVTNSFKRKE